MRASQTKSGLTVRVIAGTYNVIIGIDLQENKRKGCLGFSIERSDLGPANGNGNGNRKTVNEKPAKRWLPNMITFPSVKADGPITTEASPLQKFRWGDYTLEPASRYRFRVIPRYGKPGSLASRPELAEGVEVEVTTEDPFNAETYVHFNRAAAASRAFEVEFPSITSEALLQGETKQAKAARAWLSRGIEEACLAFMDQARDSSFALHAAIYEFQKPNLLEKLGEVAGRGAQVQVAYHHRVKDEKDHTASKNDAAIKAAKIGNLVKERKAAPQSAIMHNKFVVLLKREGHGGEYKPFAAWTGSMNWTDGGVYGQLNVGHAVFDPAVASDYEQYFQLLHADSDAATMKRSLAHLTPVSLVLPDEHNVVPIFSPQSEDTMLRLYAMLCERAKCLMVSAPFALSGIILETLSKKSEGVLRYLLLDKERSLGKGEDVHLVEGDQNNAVSVAVTLKSPLHDFQGKVLEGKHESFVHPGIHIHSKIILIDPLGSDPIVITGSANFSRNSTEVNDSNTIVLRGHTAVADIYVTEFMRMFEHYHFRAKEAAKAKKAGGKGNKNGNVIVLAEDDSWSDEYYVFGSTSEHDRRLFAGTH